MVLHQLCCFADSKVGPDRVVLLQWVLLEIGSIGILDTIICLGHCFGCSLLPGTLLDSP